MRIISNNNKLIIKLIILYFALAFIAVFALTSLSNQFKADIAKLEIEVSELESQKENLLQLKTHYEDLVNFQDELEINLNSQIEILEEENIRLKNNNPPTRSADTRKSREFTITCYDLSVQSCGKPIGSKGYGITASGYSLIGHTWETARAIAADPKLIPLGTKVELTFTDENYSKYNGIYTNYDKGGAIKGNRIDFFLGDFNQNEAHQDVWDFGRTTAIVKILDGGK